MDNEYIKKLHSWGLDWGQGDSRNPDEVKEGKGGQHTNRTVSWLKIKMYGMLIIDVVSFVF